MSTRPPSFPASKENEEEKQRGNSEKDFCCVDPDVGNLLSEYMDDTLSSEQRKRFETHLRYCALCSEDYYLRQRLKEIIGDRWPEVERMTDTEKEEGSARRLYLGGFHPLRLLISWRVPALVPAVLLIAIFLPWVFQANFSKKYVTAPVFMKLDERATYQIKPQSRATRYEQVISAPAGNLLRLTIKETDLPLTGWPIVLVIDGTYGKSGSSGLPFQESDGGPILDILIPADAGGRYSAKILSGPDRVCISRISILVETIDEDNGY